ncbi:hypothetical protein HWQ46_09885 [Shewanella sp. D64]|uniref:hypothetical protein n=1 Tax=unclassified Shewanella TaxID=196818 RepID=UPI0022BA48FD|nr:MULTISPECIES: hypothetical protein [unclassified Shewanella]MEC4725853.1 hypothetical protein [Shewanella sp. D64]MEC4737108.1 hypothetical protein [Shewanella sp. E94]WBJ93564.1 hypothetical protein HWQ47_16715 [Shewanella sp. MTB7]WBJ95700.1 hypothetical protein HWQ47_00755 [Shewanella sp. MTB7]
MWDSVKNIIGSAAPLLGSLLAGSSGEKVGNLIAGALGVPATPTDITNALNAHPELLIELQKLEFENKAQLIQLQLSEIQAAAASEQRLINDVQDARLNNKDHPMVSVLTLAFLLMTALISYVVVRESIPAENRDMAMFIFGQIIGFTASVVNFWMGANPKNSLFKKGNV